MRTRAILGILLFALLAITGGSPAQAPKKAVPPEPKFTAQQIAEAEGRLQAFRCALHYEVPPDAEDDDAFVPVMPRRPRGPVDLIAFLEVTTDADLAKLIPFAKRLPALKVIDLGPCKKVTAAGLKHLAQLPDLEGLFLDGLELPDAALRELAAMPSLMWLDLSNTSITAAAIPELAKIRRLQSLILRHVPRFSAVALGGLSELKSLRVLHTTIEDDPAGKAQAIAKLKQITELAVSPLSDEEAPEIGKLDGLRVLDVSNPVVNAVPPVKPVKDIAELLKRRGRNTLTDKGLKALTACLALERLNLARNLVTCEGVSELAGLKHLRELDLIHTLANDAGMLEVARVKSLQALNVSFTAVTDAGLRELADLPALERLSARGDRVGDEGLREITRLRTLRDLDLALTRVSVVDVPSLSSLAVLRRLNLARTNVTDAVLPSFTVLRTLERLDLRENCPNVTPTGVKPLERDLSKCRILYTPRCDLGYAGGWPGAVGYAFRVPNLKVPTGPGSTALPPSRLPKAGPAPVVPPPVRVPATGGGTSRPR